MSVAGVRILLVDDELALLQLLEKYLKRNGHEVETFSKSLDALQRFEQAPDRFDLVIADLSMPDLSGDSMLTRMLEIKPSLRILICSGTPFMISKVPPGMEKQVAFLQKPFLPKMMSEALDKLLATDKH